MALMKCPECGKEVSSQATACPHCGCPVAVAPKDSAPPSEPQSAGAVATPTASETLDSRIAEVKKAATGVKNSCLGCLALIVLFVIAAIIFGIFAPKDPNYEAGKASALEMGKIESNYGAITRTPQHHTQEQSLQIARIWCPQNLTGEARDKWIQGFTDHY